MKDEFFKTSFDFEFEPKVSDLKNDKGGLTNDGITYDFFKLYCKKTLGVEPTVEKFDVLTRDEIRQFYSVIWDRLNCDDISNSVVSYMVFDFALNSEKAVRQIQRLLKLYDYNLKDDNVFGPVSRGFLNAAITIKTAKKVATDILNTREDYVRSLVQRDATQAQFLPGWLNRINTLRRMVERNL